MEEKRLTDPQVVVFAGETELKAGDVYLHNLVTDLPGKLFGRAINDVKADWEKISGQVQEMLKSVVQRSAEGFNLDSVEISLGFSAEGKLVFIAKAGVEATVSLTFKRKE